MELLRNSPLGKKGIALALGKQKPGRYLTDIIRHLLKEGLVERTMPEKPNSRLQKYRLTTKGMAVLAKK